MPGTLRVKTVSRGQGHSAVRAAAYCGRRRLVDDRTGRTHNYTRHPGLAYSELMLPRDANRRLADSGRLWNAVEAHLRRVNARLARELILGLPRGASLDAQARLVRGFLDEAFVAEGHAVDWHVHLNQPRNPHVHALVSFPTLTATGWGPSSPEWDRRAWLVGLHGLWRRHWQQHGHARHEGVPGIFTLGAAHALATCGVITRQGQRLAGRAALRRRPPGHLWPAWQRIRTRRRERIARPRTLARDR